MSIEIGFCFLGNGYFLDTDFHELHELIFLGKY